MRRLMTMRRGFAACAVAMMFGLPVAWGQASGTWNVPGTGDWDTPASWVGNIIADGANNTANFTQPDVLTGGNIVTVGVPHTIGNLVFSDSIPGTGAADNWDIQGGGVLTLVNTTQPTITVNAMNPGGAALISTPLDGTVGFAKAGVGKLTLGNVAHTISGPINVNAGTLQLDAALGGTTPATTPITFANGTTFITGVAQGPGTNSASIRQFNVPTGATANIRFTNNVEMGRITAAGATLNVTIENAGNTFTAAGNWNLPNNASGSPTAFNVNSPNGGLVALAPNLSSSNGAIRNFNANTFIGTAVSLTNTTLFTRTNSGGNTVPFGSLTGDSTSVLFGGGFAAAGGTVARYSIGALNTDTVFAGTIDSGTTLVVPTANTGGLDLNKVGTGTLTLSGTLSYVPTQNGTATNRGGITTVSAGTLKLTNNAAIPGGVTNGTTDFFSTLRVATGATLDVTGVATPYSTANLQQVIGTGTIKGNYTHDEGVLAVGDTNVTNSAQLTATAGTMTFANNLSFAGTGNIRFNISNSTTSGNDKIVVSGVTTLTGTPTLSVTSLGGVTNGNYPIIESAGGFAGSFAGWVVNVGGRGGGAPLSLSPDGKSLLLAVSTSAFGNIRWSGATDSTWVSWTAATPGPLNWSNTVTNVADRYFDFDTVTFADTFGPANTPVTNSTVALATTVTPSAVNVSSATVDYTISGAGKISGGGTFTKSGAATLTMTTANDFSGTATINAGKVSIGTATGALGTGGLVLAGGTVAVDNTAQSALTNSSLTINGTGSRIEGGGTAGSTIALPAISGSGSLTLVSTVTNKIIDLGANNGFTGALTVDNATIRFNGANSSLANSAITLLNGADLRDQVQGEQTITIGSLTGEATTTLGGYQGGGNIRPKTWRVGSLNTSTTFDGRVVDLDDVVSATNTTSLVKIGTGTLTLTGANAYSGYTSVQAGTLSIAQATLTDAADVLLFTGATLNLTTGTTDLIDQLFVNGISQPVGTYGAVGSGAQFTSPLITGTGTLQVNGFRLPGDFDNSGTVDAADLAVWKTGFGVDATGDTDGDRDSDGNDFLIWQRFLGATNPTVAASGAVPEPGTLALAGAALVGLVGARRRRS